MGVSGIVLAGGMSQRLGRNKAVELVGGESLICRVIGRLSRITDETVVTVANPRHGCDLPLSKTSRLASDMYPGGGSLGGICTGLSAARMDWGIVAACDMPFLDQELLEYILAQRGAHDAVIPMLGGRPEPTHAAYSKRCLPAMERRLKARELKIAGFFDEVRVGLLSQEDLEDFDPEHLSFMNVNTEEDLARARALVASGY